MTIHPAERSLQHSRPITSDVRDTIRRAPTHVEARLALASLHIDQNRFAAAERELAEIIQNVEKAIDQPEGEKLKPLAARCRNLLGHVLYRLGNHSTAVEVLDMAMADAGDDLQRQAQILGDRALALVIKLHQEAVLSEGQCCSALELDRVTFRKLCDREACS